MAKFEPYLLKMKQNGNLQNKVHIVEIWHSFFDADTKIITSFFDRDGLHLSNIGYNHYSMVLRRKLDEF